MQNVKNEFFFVKIFVLDKIFFCEYLKRKKGYCLPVVYFPLNPCLARLQQLFGITEMKQIGFS